MSAEEALQRARREAWEEGKQAFIAYSQGARRKVPYPVNPYAAQEPTAAPETPQEPTVEVRIPQEHLDAYIEALQGMRQRMDNSSLTFWKHAGDAELHGNEILDAIVKQIAQA